MFAKLQQLGIQAGTGQPIDAYTDSNAKRKALFKSEATKLARAIGAALGYQHSDYDIRYNPGGIAVPGDVTFHSDKLYVHIDAYSGYSPGFYFRTCKGRKDYTGEQNRWVKWEELSDFSSFVARLKLAIEDSTLIYSH